MFRKIFAHPLGRRLPLVLVAAIALWYFQGPQKPAYHLYWALPYERADVVSVELQISTMQGQLLKREEFFLTQPPPSELVQKVSLPPGTYVARAFLHRGKTADPSEMAQTFSLHLAEEENLNLTLDRPAR